MRPHTRQTYRLSYRGFSLVELVLVMLIVGVIGAIAVPRFARASEGQRLEAAVQRIIADIALAKARADAASEDVTVSFNTSTDVYKISAVGGEALAIELAASPYQVDLVSAVFSQDAFVKFNAFGIPQSPGSVTVSTGSHSVTLTINASGEVTR